jgi:curved DNA-binding protein CbpA
MKLDSKYFDRIRIKPDGETVFAATPAPCEWPGCDRPGGFRAPKGRMREGQYYNYCLDHVRDYNKSYNYFAGMDDDDVAAYQKASTTGHRPTWAMGVNSWGEKRDQAHAHRGRDWSAGFADTFGFFGSASHGASPDPEEPRRILKNMERRSFAVLDLEGHETSRDIKSRFKTLVKRLHPDANGGDRSSEDKLREIIQAYNYLKAAGFC